MTNFIINCLLEDLITLFDSTVGCVPVKHSLWLSHSVPDSLTRQSGDCQTHARPVSVRKRTHVIKQQLHTVCHVLRLFSHSDLEVKRCPGVFDKDLNNWLVRFPLWCVKTGLS